RLDDDPIDAPQEGVRLPYEIRLRALDVDLHEVAAGVAEEGAPQHLDVDVRHLGPRPLALRFPPGLLRGVTRGLDFHRMEVKVAERAATVRADEAEDRDDAVEVVLGDDPRSLSDHVAVGVDGDTAQIASTGEVRKKGHELADVAS